jgi:hypothetical protein
MTKTPANVTAADVSAFSDFCASLRYYWWHYHILFEGSDLQRELLLSIAPKFFSDIRDLLNEHLILKICKITDPEESTGGRKNLTAKFLVKNSDFSTAPTELDKLKKISESMHKFRDKIVPARNKLIGHLDRESVHLGQLLGGADVDEWHRFWRDLQDFVQILHKRYVDPSGVFYLNNITQPTDVDSLIKALKESNYFRALLNDKALTKKVSDTAFNSKYFDA